MGKCWYKLNIDVSNAINTNFNFREFVPNLDKNDWALFTPELSKSDSEYFYKFLNSKWLADMSHQGLTIITAGFFYKPGNYDPISDKTIHVDPGRSFAINWVIDPGFVTGTMNEQFEDSGTMLWFNTNTQPYKNFYRMKSGSIDTIVPYLQTDVNASDLKEIDRLKLNRDVYLLRVDTPHCVPTDGRSPRVVITMCIKIDDPTWDNVVNYCYNKKLIANE